MKKLVLLLSVLILSACSKTDVVYVDKNTREVISDSVNSASVKMMRHLEVDEIVCIGNYQYYKVIVVNTTTVRRSEYFPVYQSGYTIPQYCSDKTLANGSSL